VTPGRKIDEEALARLRHLHAAEGWALRDLAAEFGLTRQYVGRLVAGLQREQVGPLDASTVRSSGVLPAVERLLGELPLDPAAAVLAATSRALASKLDSCATSDSASSAAAMPRLAVELVEVLGQLREDAPREPSALDELVAGRDARRLANAARGASS